MSSLALDIDPRSDHDLTDDRPSVAAGQAHHALPAVLDLTQAQTLRNTMLNLLAGGSVMLDAGDVDRMSTPCAQVILAAGRAANDAAVSFKIRNASVAFQKAFADLGLRREISNWMN